MTGQGAFFIGGHGDANSDDSCSGSGTVAALVVLSVAQERSLSAAALDLKWACFGWESQGAIAVQVQHRVLYSILLRRVHVSSTQELWRE